MSIFEIEDDKTYKHAENAISLAFDAVGLVDPRKRDQLLSVVFSNLKLDMETQAAILHLINGDVSAIEINMLAYNNKKSEHEEHKRKLAIPAEKLKEIITTIYNENLINHKTTWMYIIYWLAINCEGWTGGLSTQVARLKDLLEGIVNISISTKKTFNPKELKEVINNPEGKLGKFHYATIKRLEELCVKYAKVS
ncbi:MAG: hypothetical protein MJZ32_00895 [Bacteroidaceae bacterium]|nr:hypothetical protein [Bacteroidaceae bacterium]